MQKLVTYPRHWNGTRTARKSSDENEREICEFHRDIERAIHDMTNRGIQALRVLFESDRIVLSGHCKTYYLKQLAQEAILKITKRLEIINEIHVS